MQTKGIFLIARSTVLFYLLQGLIVKISFIWLVLPNFVLLIVKPDQNHSKVNWLILKCFSVLFTAPLCRNCFNHWKEFITCIFLQSLSFFVHQQGCGYQCCLLLSHIIEAWEVFWCFAIRQAILLDLFHYIANLTLY